MISGQIRALSQLNLNLFQHHLHQVHLLKYKTPTLLLMARLLGLPERMRTTCRTTKN